MVIIGRRLQEAEEVFTLMVKQTNKMGLKINWGGGEESVIMKAL
jgi:hypothetical protein